MIKTNDLKSWSSESSSISVGESQSIALTGIDTFDPSCLLPFLLGRKCPVEQSERERERERERECPVMLFTLAPAGGWDEYDVS